MLMSQGHLCHPRPADAPVFVGLWLDADAVACTPPAGYVHDLPERAAEDVLGGGPRACAVLQGTTETRGLGCLGRRGQRGTEDQPRRRYRHGVRGPSAGHSSAAVVHAGHRSRQQQQKQPSVSLQPPADSGTPPGRPARAVQHGQHGHAVRPGRQPPLL